MAANSDAADAIVQMDPVAHGRETWSQLPTFAQRRMAAARPISLMNVPEYEARSRQVHAIYAARGRNRGADSRASSASITFSSVRRRRRRNRPDRLAKFDTRPELFRKVFENGTNRIYEPVLESR